MPWGERGRDVQVPTHTARPSHHTSCCQQVTAAQAATRARGSRRARRSAHARCEGDVRGEQADDVRHDRSHDALYLEPVRQRQQLADRPAGQPQLPSVSTADEHRRGGSA